MSVWTPQAQCGWRSFGTGDGLVNANVKSILQDSSDAIWFGTAAGASRYDGMAWESMSGAALSGDGVEDVLEDHNGVIWLATNGGVTRIDRATTTQIQVPNASIYLQVWTIAEESSGALWFGTQGGATRYDGSTWTTLTTLDGLVSNSVGAICVDRSGGIWFGTNAGLSHFDGTQWTTFDSGNGLPGDNVSDIYEDDDGVIWVATLGGVGRFENGNWTTFTSSDGLAGDLVAVVTQDHYGRMWFGTDHGASCLDGTTWRNYSQVDGLVNDVVNAIREDRAGGIWFGTPGGVSRYAGEAWTTYVPQDSGLVDNTVRDVIEDASGALWFATRNGVSVLRSESWSTLSQPQEPLASNDVRVIHEDANENYWFGTADAGISRFDGLTWATFTTADGLGSNSIWAIAHRGAQVLVGTDAGVSFFDSGVWTTQLPSDTVTALCVDRQDSVWAGTLRGVSRYDGLHWTTYRTADGLAADTVFSILQDHSGAMWFGTSRGLSRFDGVSWTTIDDGLAHAWVLSLAEDETGDIWFGTVDHQVGHYDGVSLTFLGISDGLPGWPVATILSSRTGSLWFGTLGGGAVRYDRDRVPPETVISPRPPALIPSRAITFTFGAGYEDQAGIMFSYSFDGSPWSNWFSNGFWRFQDLIDGVHTFSIRSRDRIGNVDPTPATCTFEVDAMPPAPVITVPASGTPVQGTVNVRGTADDARFADYAVQVRPVGAVTWLPPDATSLVESDVPVRDATLATWETSRFEDDDYELRLSVSDTLGLSGATVIAVTVDNEAPYAAQTSPATLSASTGGDVYTTQREAHLYFPPHCLARDAIVAIRALPDLEVPDTLTNGSVLAGHAYELDWESLTLAKEATLDLTLSGVDKALAGTPVIYAVAADRSWRRVGGTIDGQGVRIACGVGEPGRYAVYLETSMPEGAKTLSPLTITPRVLSRGGAFSVGQVSIAFSLGRPTRVTVSVHNRAGRLVREVLSGVSMGAGQNLVRWDGRDRYGDMATDGMYVVSVEAFGHAESKILVIAN